MPADVGTPHSHSHSHAHSREIDRLVSSSPRVKLVTFAILLLVAASTALGLVSLWPDYSKFAEISERTQFSSATLAFEEGEVLSVKAECPDLGEQGELTGGAPGSGTGPGGSGSVADAPAEECLQLGIGIRSGPDTGRVVDVTVRGAMAGAGLKVGDHVELVRYPSAEEIASGAPNEQGSTGEGASEEQAPTEQAPAEQAKSDYELSQNYSLSGIFRHIPLLIIALVFAAVVVYVGRIRGLLALIALGVSVGVLLAFVLPALVTGAPGLPVALAGASAIMFAILYLVHGPNMRTTAALIGTLCGILIMSLISLVSVQLTRLSGVGDESSGLLSAMSGEIDFRGLLTASIIIAGLGVLNDVTITQASAVWELRAAAPSMPREEVYQRAMRIGRDHIASTVYTVFFAYVGAALSALIVMYLYGQPFLSLLTREDIALELVRTFCGSIGLVLAVPITTWVAALFAPPAERSTGVPAQHVEPDSQSAGKSWFFTR